MGLLDKINTIKQSGSKQSRGLLKRGLETLTRDDTPKRRAAETSQNSLNRLEGLIPSVDAPYHILPLLCSALSCERAALVVTDPGSQQLKPCAVYGWSAEVLQVLSHTWDRLQKLIPHPSSGFYTLLRGEALDPWRTVLAAGHPDTLRELYVITIEEGGKILAVLLLSGVSESSLASVEEHLVTKTRQSILGRVELLEQTSGRPPDSIEKLKHRVRKLDENRPEGSGTVSMYRLSLEDLRRTMNTDLHVISDSFVQSDLVHILGHVLGRIGTLYEAGGTYVFIPAHGRIETDAVLLSDQIGISFERFLSPEAPPPRVEEISSADISVELGLS